MSSSGDVASACSIVRLVGSCRSSGGVLGTASPTSSSDTSIIGAVPAVAAVCGSSPELAGCPMFGRWVVDEAAASVCAEGALDRMPGNVGVGAVNAKLPSAMAGVTGCSRASCRTGVRDRCGFRAGTRTVVGFCSGVMPNVGCSVVCMTVCLYVGECILVLY